MTLITRWDPLREFVTIQDRRNRLFRDSFGQEGSNEAEALGRTTFAPPVDVYEDQHSVTLKIEVPGIDENDENYRRVERQYGSFTRTFGLPNTVDQESVQANSDKGVLKVNLAKKAETKPKQI